MTFIEPCRHLRHHYSNLLALSVIIVMGGQIKQKKIWNDKRKHINCDEQGIQYALQISHRNVFTVVGLLV